MPPYKVEVLFKIKKPKNLFYRKRAVCSSWLAIRKNNINIQTTRGWFCSAVCRQEKTSKIMVQCCQNKGKLSKKETLRRQESLEAVQKLLTFIPASQHFSMVHFVLWFVGGTLLSHHYGRKDKGKVLFEHLT